MISVTGIIFHGPPGYILWTIQRVYSGHHAPILSTKNLQDAHSARVPDVSLPLYLMLDCADGVLYPAPAIELMNTVR